MVILSEIFHTTSRTLADAHSEPFKARREEGVTVLYDTMPQHRLQECTGEFLVGSLACNYRYIISEHQGCFVQTNDITNVTVLPILDAKFNPRLRHELIRSWTRTGLFLYARVLWSGPNNFEIQVTLHAIVCAYPRHLPTKAASTMLNTLGYLAMR
jgi:hypothetical protein